MSKKDIGIDLGTANTLVYLKSKGIVLNEPSVVATDADGRILAVGLEAKQMIGRTPDGIRAVRPLKDGVIADFEAAGAMLAFFIKKALGKLRGVRPRGVICVPSGITLLEKKAVEEAAISAGIREVYIIEEAMASAIGAGIDVNAPRGSMIVDIGGGTCEVAVISLGGIVAARVIRTAGDSHDEAISNYIKNKYGIRIGRTNAESVKISVGTLRENATEKKAVVSGRSVADGMPCSGMVSGSDVRCALEADISLIIEAIKYVLEKTPPELSGDILKSGVVLTGGGALLDGISSVIHNAVNIPVTVSDNPLECVAFGAGRILDKG